MRSSDLAAARRSYLVNAVSDVMIGSLLALSGLALLSFYLEHPSFLPANLTPTAASDRVMPFFFAHQLPAGLGGLLLASFLCDAMQTLDSGVNSITAVATTDVMERLAPRRLAGRASSQLAPARPIDLRRSWRGCACCSSRTTPWFDAA